MMFPNKKIITILLFLFIGKLGKAQSYNFKNYSVENGLPFIQIFNIYQDSKGYLWTGGYGGLSKFDGSTFSNYSPKQGLANHFVNAITEDDKNNLWVGTKDGLNKFVGEKIVELLTTQNGLLSNNIKALLTNTKNGVLIGTDKGLNYIINNTVFTKQELVFKNINYKIKVFFEKLIFF